MSLGPGSTLGPFKIQSLLGKGGMGEVFCALDTRLDRKVALKILASDFAADSDRLRRFQSEAKTLASISHPNILVIHEVGTDGTPYLVSELLEGRTLRDELNSISGALPLRKLIEYALQIANGLAAAHARGIIHRDLKPENIFITKDARLKILDFGLAKLNPLVGADVRRLTSVSEVKSEPPHVGSYNDNLATLIESTAPGMILGTPGYMSPEQIRGEPADHRSDLFSFGCILYELVSGVQPYARKSVVESMNAVLNEEPAPLSTINPNIPSALERIVNRCLEKEPARRFQTADDLAFALDGLSNASTSTRPIQASVSPRFTRTLAWTVPLVAFATLLGTFIGARLMKRTAGDPTATRPVSRKIEIRLPPPLRKDAPPGLRGPSLSPDGRKLAYVNFDGLWLRRLDQLNPPVLLLPGAQLSAPFWSANGAEVACFEENILKRVPITGAPPSKICAASELSPSTGFGAWLENGEIIFAGRNGLYEVSAKGGEPTLCLQIAEEEARYRNVTGLPDGSVLFVADLKNGRETLSNQILVWNSKTGPNAKRVVLQLKGSQFSQPRYSNSGHLVFLDLRDGRDPEELWAISFSLKTLQTTGDPFRVLLPGRPAGISRDGTLALAQGAAPGAWYAPRQLVWVNRSGKLGAPIGAAHQGLSTPRLSPDERFVAFAAGKNADTRQIWTLDLTSGALLPLNTDSKFQQVPFWLPNGHEIAFTGGPAPSIPEALICPLEGGTNRTIAHARLLHLSPSGRYAFLINGIRRASTNTYLDLSIDPAQPVLLPATSPRLLNRLRYRPNLSPDDSTLAFESDESGRDEIWAIAFPAFTNRVMISRGGGIAPQWSRDGKELFFLSEDARAMMSAPVLSLRQPQFGPPVKLFDIPASIYVGESFSRYGTFDVSADRQRFLMMYNVPEANASPAEVGTTVLLVENWFEEYRHKP